MLQATNTENLRKIMRFVLSLALLAVGASAGPVSCNKGCDHHGDDYLSEPERPGSSYLSNACEVELCEGDGSSPAFLDDDEAAEFCLTMNIAAAGPYPLSKSVSTGEMVVTRTAEPDRYIALGCNNAASKAAHEAHYAELYAGATITFTETQSDNTCQANSEVLHGDPNIIKCQYGTFNKGPWKYCHDVLCMHKDDKCLSIDYDGDFETWTSGFGCLSDPAATCDSQKLHPKFKECGAECGAAGGDACNVCVSGAFDKPAPSGVAMGILAVTLVTLSWLTSN